MEETKDSPNPSPDQESQTFKQHYAGTFVGERQIKQAEAIADAEDSANSTQEPNDPLEAVMRLWTFIKDPDHSGAVIAILTLVIAGSNIGYDIVASCQLKSMNKQLTEMQLQTTLSRQQLVGTMAASVILQEPRITPDQTTGKQILVMQLANRGHVMSPEAHVAFEIHSETFPQMSPLSQAEMFSAVVPQLGESGWIKSYSLPDFSVQNTHFLTQRKTITIKGKFGFSNGFGDTIPDQEFCYSYIGTYNTKNEDGGSTNGGGGFVPCDEFGNRVSYILKHPLPK